MNKFNPEAIICADYSIDVVLFDGDLTPEECSDVFEKAVHEDYPIPMLHDVIILGTEEYYDAIGMDVICVHYLEDDFWEITTHNNIVRALKTRASELKFLADMEPPRRDGVPITNDGYLLSAYSYESLDAFENYMRGVKYAPSIIGEDGLALPPLPIHDDIEDIPF